MADPTNPIIEVCDLCGEPVDASVEAISHRDSRFWYHLDARCIEPKYDGPLVRRMPPISWRMDGKP
jgi:hypothetical protein